MSATAVSAEALDALLPQTQCRLCGYTGCRPYAVAMAAGTAAINRCPPGGTEVIAEIAAVLDMEPVPPDTARGSAAPPAVARIDEAACIGCTLCIAACPVDAIVGARRLMHTVIAADCTGCALCLPPCPVDCIALVPTGAPRDRSSQKIMAARARERYRAHLQRLAGNNAARNRTPSATSTAYGSAPSRKHAAIARALARAQARIKKNINKIK